MTIASTDDFRYLPDELKLEIFKYVRNPFLIQQVCRDWNRLGHDPQLFVSILEEQCEIDRAQKQLHPACVLFFGKLHREDVKRLLSKMFPQQNPRNPRSDVLE